MIQLADKAINRDQPRRPRVVMLLANEFVHDTRVFKEACSLAQCGCEVIILAQARVDLPRHEVQQGFTVIRLSDKPRHFCRLGMILLLPWMDVVLRRMLKPRHASGGDAEGDTRLSRLMATTRTFKERMAIAWNCVARAIGRLVVPRSQRPGVYKFARRANNSRAHLARSMVKQWHRLTSHMKRMRRGFMKSIRPRHGWLPGPIRPLLFNIHLARAARALRPDVVHAHDLNTLLAGALVKRLDGVRLVYDSHELFLERNLPTSRRRIDRAFWAPVERNCIRQCDLVISVSEGICRHLRSQYRIPKPSLIRNVQPYGPPIGRHRLLSRELGLPEDTAVVLYPGAITVNRGLEQMIDSAPHLRNAAYVVMGYARNAKYLESLKERARRLGVLGVRVYFRDAVPINEVVRYTASADLGIVPTQNICLSYYYESSNKIFHCLMAGVPVAMSDHIEKRLVVEEHGVGVLFDERDPRAIAEAVNNALADRARYARMQEACLKAALELNWEREEMRLRSLYAKLLGVPALTAQPAVQSAPEIKKVPAEPTPVAAIEIEARTSGAVAGVP